MDQSQEVDNINSEHKEKPKFYIKKTMYFYNSRSTAPNANSGNGKQENDRRIQRSEGQNEGFVFAKRR